MINRRELRSGNYILDDEGNIVVVRAINDLSEHWPNEPEAGNISFEKVLTGKFLEYFECNFQSANPIPLSDIWLGYLSFEPTKGVYEHPLTGHYLAPQSPPFSFYIGEPLLWSEPHYRVREIKYVHELQNLYFALTGNELTITA